MKFFYVLTVQYPGPGSATAVRSTAGPVTVEPGYTRTQVFEHLMQKAGAPADAQVLCFYLEPDQL